MIKLPVMYRVVEERDLQQLCSEVNSLLKLGYEPQGGVIETGPAFAQAMVLHEYVSEMEYARRRATQS